MAAADAHSNEGASLPAGAETGKTDGTLEAGGSRRAGAAEPIPAARTIPGGPDRARWPDCSCGLDLEIGGRKRG